MKAITLAGNTPVVVTLRRSTRARRLSLRVSRLDGSATLTLPGRVPLREGVAFVEGREDWLRSALSRCPAPLTPEFGVAIPFRGGELTLTAADLRAPRVDGARLLMPPDAGRLSARLGAFLRAEARQALVAACDRHAARLGLCPAAIVLRDTRTRWGSCSAQGRLMFSWRLILAPDAVLDYVAAHEVAHLARMDHSPAFWAVVERLLPDHHRHRAWLRQHGEDLHALRL